MQSPVPRRDSPLHQDRLGTTCLGSRSAWERPGARGGQSAGQELLASLKAESFLIKKRDIKDIDRLLRVQQGPPWWLGAGAHALWGVAKGVVVAHPGDDTATCCGLGLKPGHCGGTSQQPPSMWRGDWKDSGHKLKKESFQLGGSKLFFNLRRTECWAGCPEKLWRHSPWRFSKPHWTKALSNLDRLQSPPSFWARGWTRDLPSDFCDAKFYFWEKLRHGVCNLLEMTYHLWLNWE